MMALLFSFVLLGFIDFIIACVTPLYKTQTAIERLRGRGLFN